MNQHQSGSTAQLCPNSPMAEALLSKSKCCEFESHFGHQNFGEVNREKNKMETSWSLFTEMANV